MPVEASESAVLLFTDIVESTRLMTGVSPETAEEIRRGHFAVLREAVSEHGGEEIKNLGDGMMVLFTSAARAISCAVAMQQGTERANYNSAHPIGLRTGLSGGDVIRDEGDCFGDPVVEASRLCARCVGGQVLAAEIVRIMAGRRCRHECRSAGALELKGLPDPVSTIEVLWEPLTHSPNGPVPLPRTLELHSTVGIVERDVELAQLADALHRTTEEKGRQLILISGEAGQGKTTLAAAAARAGWEAGACVLFGHCDEDLGAPYQLFAEALRHYALHADGQTAMRMLRPYASELVRLIPELTERVPDLAPSRAADSDAERYMLFAAVVSLLASLGERQPVILVLDDLQWADKGSLQLLRHVAISEHATRLLVVGTYRDTELHGSTALVELLGALRRLNVETRRIELSGLDDAGVALLMEGFAGHALDPAALRLSSAVSRETNGNPFFVVEVLRHLAETGAIFRDALGKWSARSDLDLESLPDSVRDVVRARVVRLREDSQRVLSLASVIGLEFDLDLLSEASQIPEDALLDLLDAARAVALVREHPEGGGRYTFTHPLIQRLVYEGLGSARQGRYHRVIGEALEALGSDHRGYRASDLARHWVNATKMVDLVKAINYSKQAADAALAGLAPDDAVGYYTQALDLHDRLDEPDRLLEVDLTIGLGTAQRQSGDVRFRQTLVGAAHQAEALGDIDRLVAAALANDRGTFSTVSQLDHEKVAILELAIARLPENDRKRALLLALLCSELTVGSPLEQRQGLAAEALDMAEAHGDNAVTVVVLNHVQIPLAVPPLLATSVARSTRALELAQRVGDPALLRASASGRRYSAACEGDVDEMDRCFEITKPLVEQLDQPFMVWVESLQRSTRALIAGDADSAERFANLAFQVGTESGQPDAFIVYGAQMLMVCWWRGSLGDMVPLIEAAIAENPGLPFFNGVLAMAHAEGDRPGPAREILARFGKSDYELPMEVTWLTGMVAYAEAASQTDDARAASALLEQLRPYDGQWHYSDIAAAGPLSRSLGNLATVLGRYDEAEDYFARAWAASQAARAWFFAARTALSWGTMLTRRGNEGDAELAREMLTRAQDLGEEHGYANITRRARATQGNPVA
jgi:class 3 adenylate cyclase